MIMQQKTFATAGLLLGLLMTAGCATTTITYKTKSAAAPAAVANVVVKVVDERPADKGGQDKNQVGQVRGSYGIPSAVKDGAADVAPRTVLDATTDALRQARVGTQAGSSKTLVTAIKHYWMDGMMGYKATIAVQYSLQDSAGKTLWSAEVKGGAGGALIIQSPQSFTQGLIENALADLAAKAAEQFKSAEFQKALG